LLRFDERQVAQQPAQLDGALDDRRPGDEHELVPVAPSERVLLHEQPQPGRAEELELAKVEHDSDEADLAQLAQPRLELRGRGHVELADGNHANAVALGMQRDAKRRTAAERPVGRPDHLRASSSNIATAGRP